MTYNHIGISCLFHDTTLVLSNWRISAVQYSVILIFFLVLMQVSSPPLRLIKMTLAKACCTPKPADAELPIRRRGCLS